MKPNLSVIACLAFLLSSQPVLGQHCAGLIESYLSEIALTRLDDDIQIKLMYQKLGGRHHKSYQAYLLAYKDSDSVTVLAQTPQQSIEQGLVSIVNTQVIEQQEAGRYAFKWTINQNEFGKAMLKEHRIDRSNAHVNQDDIIFKDKICLALFIPHLEDAKYSVEKGLPVDRHECNYGDLSALLFDELPYRLTFDFGVWRPQPTSPDQYHVYVNGRRPATINKQSDLAK